MKLFYFLMDLLFPPKCILCGKLLQNRQQDLCHDCRTDSPEYPVGKDSIQFLDSFTAVWYYEGIVRRSLLRYKFYGARGFAQGYGMEADQRARSYTLFNNFNNYAFVVKDSTEVLIDSVNFIGPFPKK
jgi:predicted amidophosphoribosyltransferase